MKAADPVLALLKGASLTPVRESGQRERRDREQETDGRSRDCVFARVMETEWPR